VIQALLRQEGCGSAMIRGVRRAWFFQSPTMSASNDTGDLWHEREKPVVPKFAAFAARRQIALRGIKSGKTKSHRHDGEAGFVVESLTRDIHPGAQTIAGRIVVRNTGVVDARAGRLPGEHQPRTCRDTYDRARFLRQAQRLWQIAAIAAGANASRVGIKVRG
jgi:hypothetical protein